MKNNFFNKSPIINVLEKPKKNSNVSSQILYGERFKILSKNKNFYKVKNYYDNYVGFISKKIKLEALFNPSHKVKTLKSQIYFGTGISAKVISLLFVKATPRLGFKVVNG